MVLVCLVCVTPDCESGLGLSVMMIGGGRILLIGYMIVLVTLAGIIVF